MKKLILSIGLMMLAAGVFGQGLWATHHSLTSKDSIRSSPYTHILVEDADSTHTLPFSVLNQWYWMADDSTYIHGRVDDIVTDTANWNTAYERGDHATAGYASAVDLHDAVTVDGEPDYITISGQTITRYAIDLANDITGQLSLSNINATGTPSSSNFLRGDGTWATPESATYKDVWNAGSVTIAAGDLVEIIGSAGAYSTVRRATNTISTNVAGIATESFVVGVTGQIQVQGTVENLNTSGLTAGELLWLGADGTFVDVQPNGSTHDIKVGLVGVVAPTGGTIILQTPSFEVDATDIVYDNSASGLTSTRTQAAVDEIADKMVNKADSTQLIAGTNITFTEGTGTLTISSSGGSAELDSSNLTFKDEIEPLFFFNLGRGVAADTSLFEVGSMIDPKFNRSRDTLVITNITGGARGKSGDTLQYQVMYAPKFGALDSTMVPLMEGSPMDLPVGSDGTANVDESVIVNDAIPPDNWVWAQLVNVTADDSITAFASTVSGYKVKGTFDSGDPFADANAPPDVLYNTDSTLGWWEVASANITTDEQDSAIQLNDLSGNTNHLTANDGDGTAPYYNPGSDSLVFDGVRNMMYKTIALADQPVTVYAVFKVNSHTTSQILIGGQAVSNGKLRSGFTNELTLYSGSTLMTDTGPITYNQWYVVTYKVDGANSWIKLDNVEIISGNAGSNDINGFGIASHGNGNDLYGHLTFKGAVLSVAKGLDTEAEIYNYLSTKYGL